MLLILCIGFHFLSEGRFFTGQNLGIVLQQAAVNTVLAAGMRPLALLCTGMRQ